MGIRMVEVTLLETRVVCLFVVYLLEVEFFIVFRIILESVLIAIEPITLLIDVGSYMANFLFSLSCLVFWYYWIIYCT